MSFSEQGSSASVQSSGTGHSNGTNLPDFEDIQKKYTKRLLLGRHPRSFPRQSELWHHTVSSNSRLARIHNGHKLWNVVDDEVTKAQINDNSTVLDSEADKTPKNEFNYTSTVQLHEKKKQLESLNGISVDMKSQVRLHFGMSFFIMNFMDEVLCVNKWDEVLCKPQNKLTQSDRITFKLIDLEDPTNPGAIKYGRPIWLQIIDTSSIADNSLQSGSVVGSQLFEPPEMGSVQKSKTSTKNDVVGLDKLIEICGGLKAIRITGAAGKEEVNEKPNSHIKGYRNKNAWHLGQWVCRSALRDQSSLDDYVNALSPIFMEQDLYCLASSMGNHYENWPKRAQDPRLLKLRREDPHSTLSMIENNPGSIGADLHKANAVSPKPISLDDDDDSMDSSSSLKKGLEIAASDNENFDHGVLRKVVLRGLPYEHMVDRRCVWRFCIADSAGDLKLLSAKEQIAQKIMRKARAGLERSKRNRTGNTRMYEEQALKGRPLVGGETFPRTLRHMTAEFSLEKEAGQLANVRNNQEAVDEHFVGLFEDIDVHRKRVSRSSSAKRKNTGLRSQSRSTSSGMMSEGSDGVFMTSGVSSSDFGGLGQSSSSSSFLTESGHELSPSARRGMAGSASQPTLNQRSYEKTGPGAGDGNRNVRFQDGGSTQSTGALKTEHAYLDAVSRATMGARQYRQRNNEKHLIDIIDSSIGEGASKTSPGPMSGELGKVKSYGETICDLHTEFENVNNKITRTYISRDSSRQVGSGRPADQGRANAIAGDNASTVLKLAQKLQGLREEDTLVQEALNHRERVNQYKHISDIFDEFISPSTGAERTATTVECDGTDSEDDM